MKKETITVQVGYEIEYDPGYRKKAIKGTLNSIHYAVERVEVGFKVTRLHNTGRLVEAPDA